MANAPINTVAVLPVASTTHPSRRVSQAELSGASWWRGLGSSHETATRGRFSIDKTRRFIAYRNTTSRLRRLVVVCVYPLPGPLIALGLALVPVTDPKFGVVANWAFFVGLFGLCWVVSASVMVQARAVSSVDHREYGTLTIAAIAVISALFCVGYMLLLSSVWRFPVPFTWAFAPFALVAGLVVAHTLGFRGHGQLSRQTRTKLLLYVPSLALQSIQLTIYAGYSVLFAAANEWQQVALVVLFPLIKYTLKRSILTASRHLGDFAREVAGAGVEICASMYQATIMQSTPSPFITASVIGVDALQNVIETKLFMERRSVVPIQELLARAFATLTDTSRPPIDDSALTQFGTRTQSIAALMLSPFTCSTPTISRVAHSPAHTLKPTSTVDNDSIVLVHALEILQSAETILLCEYLEVAVPCVNAFYVAIASNLPSAIYNPKLVDFYFDPSLLRPAIRSILLYTLLQGLTLVAMYVVMRVRYRLSAFSLLAFVLETHTWSLLGKLISWIVIILAFPVFHYGMDFTFRFEFTVRTS